MTHKWPNANVQTVIVLTYVAAVVLGALIGAAIMSVVCWLC